jgi:hypothetical protein
MSTKEADFSKVSTLSSAFCNFSQSLKWLRQRFCISYTVMVNRFTACKFSEYIHAKCQRSSSGTYAIIKLFL